MSQAFNLKLSSVKSIYDKVVVKEYVDRRLVAGFVKNKMGISYKGIERYKNLPYDCELDMMVKYNNEYKRNYGCFVSTHILPKHSWGRINAIGSLSLALLHRPTRHSLARDKYVDLDMQCCQPVLISQILKQHYTTLSALDAYVNNYKELRVQIAEHHGVSKDVAKQLPLRILFGGTYQGWRNDYNVSTGVDIPLFVELQTQMVSFSERIWSENKDTIYKDCLKYKRNDVEIQKWKTEADAKRGVMGLWCQTVERMMQETAIQWLVDNKRIPLDTIIPCQDGCMVLKEHYYEGIVEDMSRSIADKYGLSVGWVQKPFDEAIEIVHYEGVSRSVDEWIDFISPAVISNTFLELHNKNVAWESGIFYTFRRERWFSGERADTELMLFVGEDMYDHLRGLIEDDAMLKEKEQIELLARLRSNTSCTSNVNITMKWIKGNTRELKNTFNQIPYLIGFEDGCYDLRTQVVRPYRYDDYMTTSTGRDFVDVDYDIPENAQRRDFIATMIEDIMPDEGERMLLLQVLASGLDGYDYSKLHIFTGAGGNGKGVLINLLSIAIGDYFYQPPVALLRDLQKIGNSSPELYGCMNKRWISFTEVKDSISEGVVKTLTGGGDFSARPLYGKPTTFKMSATFCMEFNNPPDLDGKAGQAEARRLCQHTFLTNYCDSQMFGNKIGKTINGIRWKEANPYIGTPQFYKDMRDVFFDMLCGVWRHFQRDERMHFDIPESVNRASMRFLEDQNVFKRCFEEKYVSVEYNPAMTQKEMRDISISYKEVWDYVQQHSSYKVLKTTQKRLYNRDACHQWLEETFGERCWEYKKLKCVAGIALKYNDYAEVDDAEEES